VVDVALVEEPPPPAAPDELVTDSPLQPASAAIPSEAPTAKAILFMTGS
jgi:hypothetical protein